MYTRITHHITEEHFDHPAAAEIKSYADYCSTASMGFYSTGTQISVGNKESEIIDTTTTTHTVMLTADAILVNAEAYKMWNDFNHTNQNIVIAAINNPSQLPYLQATAITNINAIGQYVQTRYGIDAGSAVVKTLTDVENSLITLLEAESQGKSITELVTILDAHILELGNLLSSANPIKWPSATVTAAFKQYVTLLISSVTAQMKKQWDVVGAITTNTKSLINTIANVFGSGFVEQPKENL